MLRKLQEILSRRDASAGAALSGLDTREVQQPQFNGQLLDQKREDAYMLMHQQVGSLR